MAPRTVNRRALLLVAVAIGVIALGVVVLGLHVADYLGHPHAISSTAGRMVYTVDGELVSYDPFELGPGVVVVGGGIALLPAAMLAGAATWRGRRAGHPPRR